MIGWIPWLVLIVVLLVALLLFLYVYDEVILEKKRPMFQCSGNGC
jgi:YbbR domain-containing protein